MILDTIVSTDDLLAHLQDPNWLIVDCRFDLSNPAWGGQEYELSHIPGAVYAHLDYDLASPRTELSGRHPLPERQSFLRLCSIWGIGTHTQVVAYDSLGGAYAARLWWLLQDYNHPAAAVLDGGFQKWLSEGKPIRRGQETRTASPFQGEPGHMPVVTTEEMEKLVDRHKTMLIDACSQERYTGLVEPIDPVAGHIPGAVNRFHGLNLDKNNTFQAPDKLREEFEVLLKGTPAQNAVVYCGSGVTSCHHILAMKIAGLAVPRLYAGSWSEWIRSAEHLVTKDT